MFPVIVARLHHQVQRHFEYFGDLALIADKLLPRIDKPDNRRDAIARADDIVCQSAEYFNALGRQADCLLARMSGSGATCFGLFDSAAASASAARHIAERQPAWWAVSSPLIGDSDKVEISSIPAYM